MNIPEKEIILERIKASKKPVIVSIDGRCASGKSTLAKELAEELNADVIHMDDFYLRKEQRTPERYAEPGGNVDAERFLSEVLIPLKKGKAFTYHPFDCTVMDNPSCLTEPMLFSYDGCGFITRLEAWTNPVSVLYHS